MSTKDLKALERHFEAEFNKGKASTMAVMDETCAPNVVYHASGTDLHGLKELKQYFSDLFDAFPDFHMTLDDIIVEGDKAVIRFRYTGTHKGPYMGIPPTNKKVTGWAIEIDRVAGGKFVEGWERSDMLGMMQQLGVIPTPKR